MDELSRNHSPANREKLRRAGLSMQSELRPNEIARLDALDPDDDSMTGESMRRAILDPVDGGVIKGQPKERGPTAGEQAVDMLRERGSMHYKDLAQALLDEGKVQPKGKTFAQTLSAELSRRDDVERIAPGVYAAKEEDA